MCVCVRVYVYICALCVCARACVYDTDQCRTHLNSLWFLFVCMGVGGVGGGRRDVCLSVWCFAWVVGVELCSTCVYNIILRLIRIT